MREAQQQLARDGLTIETRFGETRVHPCVAVERDARAAFCRCVRELGLDLAGDPDDCRPPTVQARPMK